MPSRLSRGMPERLMKEKINSLLELFSLHQARHSPLTSYSKGMKQKILISAAILHNPDLLIFDEPLSGLDVNTMIAIRELLHGLAERGKIILYCSHVLDAMEKVCARVIMLYQGRIVANDEVGRLRDLMQLPSLEQIFRQLAKQEDVASAAREIVSVIQEG